MANRRMFSLDIVDTDKFLEMPASTQALYFHLGMRADDDGFVTSPKKIAGMVNCSIDDLKILITKNYLIPFEDGVVVITDWKVNNWVRADRKHDTRFKKELAMLEIQGDTYRLADICQPNGNQVSTKRHTEVRLGKDSIGKVNINTTSSEQITNETDKSGILILLNDKTEYNVPLTLIEKWKAAYPAVDVDNELYQMVAYYLSEPRKRKTRKGIVRSINNWLARVQNEGGRNKNLQQSKKTNKFQNMENRNYDYSELESQLLNQ